MHQWSIRKKLLSCFASTLLSVTVCVAVAVITVRGLRSSIEVEFRPAMTKLDLAGQIATRMAEARTGLRSVSLYSVTNNPDMVSRSVKSGIAAFEGITSSLNQLEPVAKSGSERAAIAGMRSGVEQWRQVFDEIVQMSASGKVVEADQMGLTRLKPVIDRMQASAASFTSLQREAADGVVARAGSSASTSTVVLMAMGLVCLLLAGLLLVIVEGVTRDIRRIASSVSSQSEGVAGAARSIDASGQTLASGSSEQAASLEETSAACVEVNSISVKNTELAEAAVSVAEQSASKHSKAEKLVADMEASMQKIKSSSDKVAHVLKVVDEIAFQTNILALNAAVEAARAGEAGLGFAVVADEVRNLAQKCAAAAQETSGLVEESIVISGEGSGKAQAVSQAIHELMADAKQIAGLVEQVQGASREQSRGTEQISTAIHQIEEVTLRIAAQAQESASAGKELSGQSCRLNESVEQLAAMSG
jgi:methyl-accepting chemotaxis protein